MVFRLGIETEPARVLREFLRTPEICRSDLWSREIFSWHLQKVGKI